MNTWLAYPHYITFSYRIKAGSSRRTSGLEGITLSLANAPYELINRTTTILGATKFGAESNNNFDGKSLARAVAESLRRGYHGFDSFNPLTQEPCIVRIYCAGIRCDAPMVRSQKEWWWRWGGHNFKNFFSINRISFFFSLLFF